MIQRKSSKIIDSVVNAAHEEHFNVTKAIRDDAPITSTNSVVKSINFEIDGDGSFILRKPVMKKMGLDKNTQYLLYNKEGILTFNDKKLNISNASTIYFKGYDSSLSEFEYKYTSSTINAEWLTEILACHSTIDFTLLSVKIDHAILRDDYNGLKLVNANWDEDTETYDIGNTLYRFIKIYTDFDDPSVYYIEMVHPEINTITSATNATTNELEVNLLLENPYAIRDLYNYGNTSCTKILGYVPNKKVSADANILEEFKNVKIWELTEQGAYSQNNTKLENGFSIITSANYDTFNTEYNCLILKAFITTNTTTAKYFCCWEKSTDDGATWEAITSPYHENKIVKKYVADMTYAEFDDVLKKDTSLENTNSYLVEKPLIPLELHEQMSEQQTISQRPDVLVLTEINLNTKYRFLIYLSTNKETPVAEDKSFTKTLTFGDTEVYTGFVDSDEKISWTISQNRAESNAGFDTDTGKTFLRTASAELYKSDEIFENEDRKVEQNGPGNSITFKSNDSNYKLQKIRINLANKKYANNNIYTCNGCALGISKGFIYYPLYDKNYINPKYIDADPIDKELQHENPYSVTGFFATDGNNNNNVYFTYKGNFQDLWLKAGSNKTFIVKDYNENADEFSIVNLSRNINVQNLRQLTNAPSGLPDAQVYSLADALIDSITVTYLISPEVKYTSTYLVSTTGVYSIVPNSSKNTVSTVENLQQDRLRIFNGNVYYNDSKKQLIIYKDSYMYATNVDSTIVQYLNSFNFSEKITKVISWRDYILLFTRTSIYLASHDINTGTYFIKLLSSTVGVSLTDADTVVTILNSIYFKSENKLYKLVPNLYSATDDILNIHQISMGINNILENIVNTYIETHNFSYYDSDSYTVFIPIQTLNKTYSIIYDFNRQIWTFFEYPRYFYNIETVSTTEHYIQDSENLYYFKESFSRILAISLKEWCDVNNKNYDDYNLQIFINSIPYGDCFNALPSELISIVLGDTLYNESYENSFKNLITPIYFEIDFGQKALNYTLYKQFLETKIILATMSTSDNFPILLDIYTDGISRDIHIDTNTDGALLKNSLDDVGVLNTDFKIDNQDYNGIFKQLIVKYSGKGKSIRHIISGNSKSLFKFYSMNVRFRVLPKKH